LARLSTELGDISHKFTILPWSGANSVFERDKTAHDLAEHLSFEHAEHPQATQLIIAHSHGGNIALRALYHLQKRDASQLSGADNANPLVVTLATPFIEVHQADFGRRPANIRRALVLAMFVILQLPAFYYYYYSEEDFLYSMISLIFTLVTLFGSLWVCLRWGNRWINESDAARQTKVQALNDVTHLGDQASAQRLLVIRAIDDEASLVLALGTILNYATTKSIAIAYFILGLCLFIAISPSTFVGTTFFGTFPTTNWILVVFSFVAILLFAMFTGSRTVHGRELALSPMECQINTQSTPDGLGSKIVTLVRSTYAKSLRHGIYDHEDCAKTIADWVRSQLPSRP
jgi:hypothetical protein